MPQTKANQLTESIPQRVQSHL